MGLLQLGGKLYLIVLYHPGPFSMEAMYTKSTFILVLGQDKYFFQFVITNDRDIFQTKFFKEIIFFIKEHVN